MVSDEDIKNTPQDKIAEKFQLHMFVAKLVGGVAGGLVGNFDVGMQTAGWAIEYNAVGAIMLRKAMFDEGGQVYEAYASPQDQKNTMKNGKQYDQYDGSI